jgi:ribosomal protein L29
VKKDIARVLTEIRARKDGVAIDIAS